MLAVICGWLCSWFGGVGCWVAGLVGCCWLLLLGCWVAGLVGCWWLICADWLGSWFGGLLMAVVGGLDG